MKKLLWIFVLLMALGCQKAELVDGCKEDSRSSEDVQDSTKVDVDVDAEGWEGSIDVGFEF